VQTSGVLSSSVTFSEFILFTEKKLKWFRSIVLKVELHVPSIRITGRSIGFCEKHENSGDETKLHKLILMYNTRETWSGANSCHPSFLLIANKFYFLYENALIWTSVYKAFFIYCLCWGHLDARSKYCKATCWKSIPYISLVLSPAAPTAYCFRESKYTLCLQFALKFLSHFSCSDVLPIVWNLLFIPTHKMQAKCRVSLVYKYIHYL